MYRYTEKLPKFLLDGKSKAQGTLLQLRAWCVTTYAKIRGRVNFNMCPCIYTASLGGFHCD